MHRGHAFSALTARRAADAAGGLFRLRIEDIDRIRCRPEFEAGILEDLAWLGILWDGPALRQSMRGDAYDDALDRLAGAGLIYRCFRTRREVAEAPPVLDETLRELRNDREALLAGMGRHDAAAPAVEGDTP